MSSDREFEVGDIVAGHATAKGTASRFSAPAHEVVTLGGFYLGRIYQDNNPTLPFEAESWDRQRSARAVEAAGAVAWLVENETGVRGPWGLWV
jgi:hypothetical protein